MKIALKELTTWGVQPGGEALELNFIDQNGAHVCLQIPFDRAQAMAMSSGSFTLPALACRSMPASGATSATSAGGTLAGLGFCSTSLDTSKETSDRSPTERAGPYFAV